MTAKDVLGVPGGAGGGGGVYDGGGPFIPENDEKPIDEGFVALHQSAVEVSGLLDRLRERLAPVMNPNPFMITIEDEVSAVRGTSPLAQQINALKGQIQGQINTLCEIMHRLEV